MLKLLRSPIPNRSLASLYFAFILFFIPFLTLLTIYTSKEARRESEDGRPSAVKGLGIKLVELKERLSHVEMLMQERKMQVNQLRRKIEILTANTTRGLKLNESDEVNELFEVANIHQFLPHLLKHPNPFKPAYRRTSSKLYFTGRVGASIVFGLPTVKRPVDYLLATLENLINNLSAGERMQAVIVVFIAETDGEYVRKTAGEIEDLYMEHIESGLLEILAPPATYYPDFDTLTPNLGDPIERVKWRAKQNLDFAYLMMYCQQKATYYVQLEDDIVSKPNYLSKMKNHALAQSELKKDWVVLEYCSLGFIGKLFKSVDLPYLITYFIMFYKHKPVDWLLYYFIDTKYCRLDRDLKDCRKQRALHWLTHKPSLFQHIGTHSSLKGKIQKLKERNFGAAETFTAHRFNPPAIATTSLQTYMTFDIQGAYNGDHMFWSLVPKAGDYVKLNFTPPTVIKSFRFRSGNGAHIQDKFYNVSVEVLPVNGTSDASSTLVKTPDGYWVVGMFQSNGIAKGDVPSSLEEISELRMIFHATSSHWALLSEIFISSK